MSVTPSTYNLIRPGIYVDLRKPTTLFISPAEVLDELGVDHDAELNAALAMTLISAYADQGIEAIIIEDAPSIEEQSL